MWGTGDGSLLESLGKHSPSNRCRGGTEVGQAEIKNWNRAIISLKTKYQAGCRVYHGTEDGVELDSYFLEPGGDRTTP
jgi:hypothetical protein